MNIIKNNIIMKPLVEIYYDFIQDFTYNNIEHIANSFHMPDNYKTIINICVHYIHYNRIDFDRLALDLKPDYRANTKSAISYRKTIFEMKVYNDTDTYLLNKLINCKDKIDEIINYLKQQAKFIKIAENLKDDIIKMINFIFYNIIFKQYRRLGNTIYFKGEHWKFNKLSLKEFTKIYQEEYIKNIFNEIGETILKFKFIEKELKEFIFITKLLWIENNKYTNNILNNYYKDLLLHEYINSSASNEIENKTTFSKLTYELAAGL